MTVWEDISLHIHKIVSCVLMIPFVELCPNRRHPPLQSFLPHILKHTPARGYRLTSFIIGKKISSIKMIKRRPQRQEQERSDH